MWQQLRTREPESLIGGGFPMEHIVRSSGVRGGVGADDGKIVRWAGVMK